MRHHRSPATARLGQVALVVGDPLDLHAVLELEAQEIELERPRVDVVPIARCVDADSDVEYLKGIGDQGCQERVPRRLERHGQMEAGFRRLFRLHVLRAYTGSGLLEG
jgi:hypothetical protein